MRYYLSNGFHNTETYVIVRRGRVSARAMIDAERRLCGMADCMCHTSAASDKREHQRHGVPDRPELGLVSVGDGWRLSKAVGYEDPTDWH